MLCARGVCVLSVLNDVQNLRDSCDLSAERSRIEHKGRWRAVLACICSSFAEDTTSLPNAARRT